MKGNSMAAVDLITIMLKSFAAAQATLQPQYAFGKSSCNWGSAGGEAA
jgi:hypothetical protein